MFLGMANENEIYPWLCEDSLDLNPPFHNLPKHPKCLLPKYDHDLHGPPEDHLKKIILAISLVNVRHDDVICKLFPYTFEIKASTWYFNLPIRTIHNWNDFETMFLDKYSEDKTP